MNRKDFDKYFGRLNQTDENIRNARIARWLYALRYKNGHIVSEMETRLEKIKKVVTMNKSALLEYLPVYEKMIASRDSYIDDLSKLSFLNELEPFVERNRLRNLSVQRQPYPRLSDSLFKKYPVDKELKYKWYANCCLYRLKSPSFEINAGAVYALDNFPDDPDKGFEFLYESEVNCAVNDSEYMKYSDYRPISGYYRKKTDSYTHEYYDDPMKSVYYRQHYETDLERTTYEFLVRVNLADRGERIVHVFYGEREAMVYVDNIGEKRVLQKERTYDGNRHVSTMSQLKDFVYYAIAETLGENAGSAQILSYTSHTDDLKKVI